MEKIKAFPIKARGVRPAFNFFAKKFLVQKHCFKPFLEYF